MVTQTLDQTKAEAFTGQMVDILNKASLAMMAGIGHQTGLFDTMAGLPPTTSEGIADAAELNERYIREWLGAMVTGRIVDHEPSSGTYALPPEHAASLTRAAGPDNLAFISQYMALMGTVEQQVVDCFRHGGGVPYSAYPRFQALQAEETGRIFDAALIDVILPLVPGLPERLARGIDVLEIGCGAGHAINLLGRAFPRSRFTGYDFSSEGIAAGRAEAAAWNLDNARFEVQDAASLRSREAYDLVAAFDVVHDLAQPATVLAAIFAALRPGGIFLMQDPAASSHLHENLDHPLAPTLYAMSTMHCMTVSLAQGGAGLGTVYGEQTARQLLADAGFALDALHRIPGDILNTYFVARKA